MAATNRVPLDNVITRHLDDQLSCICNSNNSFSSNQWQFFSRDRVLLDFHILNSDIEQETWRLNHGIDAIFLAKLLVIYCNARSSTARSVQKSFNSICKALIFLQRRNIRQISKAHLVDFSSFHLMHIIENGKLANRLLPVSYRIYFDGLSIKQWDEALRRFELDYTIFEPGISDRSLRVATKQALDENSGGALTFSDWKEGGSFNFLTLDYGRFYVEHCQDFYLKHINYAIALRYVYENTAHIIRECNIRYDSQSVNSYWKPLIGRILTQQCDYSGWRTYCPSREKLSLIEKETYKLFVSKFEPLEIRKYLHTEEELLRLLGSLSINETSTNAIFFAKQIVDQWLDKTHGTSFCVHKATPKARSSTGSYSSTWRVDWESKDRYLSLAYQRIARTVDSSIKDVDYLKSIGIVIGNSQGSSYLHAFLRHMEAIGVAYFVSLTGWRESEYGFSLNDIELNYNNDVIDQSQNPITYSVKWVVPKTSGELRLRREIIYPAYQCLIMQAMLVSSNFTSPCLYRPARSQVKHPSRSAEFIRRRIDSTWCHFVLYYPPFVELRERPKAISHGNRDGFERHTMMLPSNRIDNSTLSIESAYMRFSQEFPLVEFYLHKDKRRRFLWEYSKGMLTDSTKRLLDSRLSTETKVRIGEISSIGEVTASLSRAVAQEVIGNSLRPTPHALRHMWAEAVFRRFDGDAGWMIRSNFKHISPSMWLAYVRDVGGRERIDAIKHRVASSLLNNYYLNKGTQYAGAMDKMLRRLFSRTHLKSHEDLQNFVSTYTINEIEDIKSTPWGYCLLKRRGKVRAKCSIRGVPQRHNAAPALCLGCCNCLIEPNHAEGILLAISNDISILSNRDSPTIFKRTSLSTVDSALPILKKLNVDQETLDELLKAVHQATNFYISKATFV